MRLPKFFDNTKINLEYKLALEKDSEPDKMVLLFERQFKKDFFMSVLKEAMKKVGKKNVLEPGITSFSATRLDLQGTPGVLSAIDKKFSNYVNQIKISWKAKHPTWVLYKHEFEFIEFVEKKDSLLDMRARVAIWVSKGGK